MEQEKSNNCNGQTATVLETRAVDDWGSLSYERSHASGSTTFVEITRIPKKIEPRALTSMIIAGSNIVPKQTEICFKGDSREPVGLVEFRSPVDAHQAVERLRGGRFGQQWITKFVNNPKFADPTKEMYEKWLN